MNSLKLGLRECVDRICMKYAMHRSTGNLKIIVGAATTKQDGWISTNYPLLNVVDADTFAEWLTPGTISHFVAEHVWEHLTPEDAIIACQNCFTYLRHGGLLRVAVPDGFHPDADYIAQVKPGGYGLGADDHKVLFNYKTLSALLAGTGYQVRLLEWFDEQGQFHYEKWEIGDGLIMRSSQFDRRNHQNRTTYTSLIIDGIKS